MTIGFRPFGGSQTASTRLRVFLPIRHINRLQRKIKCEIFNPLHSDKYQMVIFQKTYTDADLKLAEQLKSRNIKTAFDLCDNHFYNPDHSAEGEKRAQRLRTMLSIVDAVSVSTAGLGRLTGRRFTVIDDMVESNIHNRMATKLSLPIRRVSSDAVRLVWFGSAGAESPRFGMVDLRNIVPDLNQLRQQLNIELTVISNSREKFDHYLSSAHFPKHYHQWNKVTFPYIMQQHDMTVIPVDVNPFTAYKTNNRPVLSLMLGLPVIANHLESYSVLSEYIRFADWNKNILDYHHDHAKAKKDVERGRAWIKSNYHPSAIAQQWLEFITKCLSDERQ